MNLVLVEEAKMNEFLQLIKNRRSIRQYKQEQVKDPEIQAIMEAAILAPNAMNQQKWHFAVIQNKEMLDKIVSVIKENMCNSGVEFLAERARMADSNPFYGAPTVVYITAEERAKFAATDGALAAENIALAAAALNIGTNIQASPGFLFASPAGVALKKEMGIPDGYAYVCNVTIGYPDGPQPEAKPRNKEVITYIR
jgi:nitroreductase